MGNEDSPPRITMRFEDVDALEEELASNLSSGRAFVPGAADVSERQRCELALVHPGGGAELCLEAEAVWVKPDGPGAGVGLQLANFDDTAERRLRAFVAAGRKKLEKSQPENVYTRVKGYSTAEQLRAARESDYGERVALERVYGKAVWDVLLRNPRITAPEVTRMARNPKLPRHLVEAITGNAGWLASSELRRSLLQNPQVTGAPLDKVLRAMPKLELTRIARQPSYPAAVRQAVKRIQGR